MTRLDSLLWKRRDAIERKDAHDGTQVTYEFPLGFSIIATRQGVMLAGSSICYDPGSIMLVEAAIKWATAISLALKAGKGIPPQDELEGRRILKSNDKYVWWKGDYQNHIDKVVVGVPGETVLRAQARKDELQSQDSN